MSQLTSSLRLGIHGPPTPPHSGFDSSLHLSSITIADVAPPRPWHFPASSRQNAPEDDTGVPDLRASTPNDPQPHKARPNTHGPPSQPHLHFRDVPFSTTRSTTQVACVLSPTGLFYFRTYVLSSSSLEWYLKVTSAHRCKP